MTALSGRKALITGANRGIGRGVALAFAEAGADVAVNYPEAGAREEAMAVAQEITKRGRRGIAVEGDVSDEAAVAAMVAEVTDTFGGIDTLVNNCRHRHQCAGRGHAGRDVGPRHGGPSSRHIPLHPRGPPCHVCAQFRRHHQHGVSIGL